MSRSTWYGACHIGARQSKARLHVRRAHLDQRSMEAAFNHGRYVAPAEEKLPRMRERHSESGEEGVLRFHVHAGYDCPHAM